MTYKERIDKRGFDELRPMEGKVGVIKNAEGSAFFKIGDTAAYAAVYGPKEVFPRFLSNSKKGILRIVYNLLPFSGQGDRVRPGPSRRSREISMVMEKALSKLVLLENFPNSMIEIYVDMTETDAGSRCCALTAASMALADAGIPMKDLIGAVAVGRVDDKIVVDLNYPEEAYDGIVADTPIAYIPYLDKISLLQNDGFITKEMLMEGLEKGKKASLEIVDFQRKLLKEHYEKLKLNE